MIFEPLQNVQMSRSKFQVTSFIDFQTYLDYFHGYEGYLDKFMDSILKVPEQPLYQRFMRDKGGDISMHPGTCDQPPRCQAPSETYHEAFDPQGRSHRIRENHESLCRNRHIHACLVQRQFDRLLNMTQYLHQNYYRVKERFLESIDYVEDVTKEGRADRESPRVRRNLGESPNQTPCTREGKTTEKRKVHVRQKRLIDLLAGIGVIINSVQIKKVKQSINRLQEQNILQDQKIDGLACYLNLTADRVKLHDEQIYALQVEMIHLHSGLHSLVAATNFHLYTYYLMNMAQLTVLKLLVGMNNLELNIDKISEYLRIMATHKATPTVILPEALRSLLRKVIQQLRPNPRLRLPYDPEGTSIWKYYDNIRVYPVLMDNMLVILLTIPILNIYRVHNLPAIPPGHQLAATYQLEGEYFAVGKHGVYVSLPHHDTVVRCINSNLAICQMDQALYPARMIKWCVYALFIQDEERVKKYCKYTISKAEQNLALSLGGYLWDISTVATETLQIRCLLETHVVTIHPPLQIIYVGNGCEGFSSSVFIPAKSDQAVIEEIEPRQKYFLEFNGIYKPDQYIGLWYQFGIVLMNQSEAQKFVKAKSFGTLDFALLNKHIQPLPIQKGGGFPVTPMMVVVGVGFTLTIIAGILLACKL